MSFQIIKDYTIKDMPHKLPNEVIDYGVKMIGAPLEWPETEGEGIKVGIIDTGVDPSHEDLQERVADYYNFTTQNPKDVTDKNGHGTHVAGIIAANRNNIGVVGVAPKCKLYIAKAFDSNGEGENKHIFNAMQWLLSKKVNVINMSFTTQNYSREFDYLIKKAYSQGTLCVCAAGNAGYSNGNKDTIEYPAKFPETICVTAIDVNKKITDFSSIGKEADIAAPGEDILSTYPESMYVTLSGTSMATPLITGSIALLQAKARNRFGKLLNPEEVKLVLNIYADDLGEKGKDIKYGYGLFSFGRIYKDETINPSTPATEPSVSSKNMINSYNISRVTNKDKYSGLLFDTFLLKLIGFNI